MIEKTIYYPRCESDHLVRNSEQCGQSAALPLQRLRQKFPVELYLQCTATQREGYGRGHGPQRQWCTGHRPGAWHKPEHGRFSY